MMRRVFALLLPLALVVGCNGSTPADGAGAGDAAEAALPGPRTAGGNSVTGMPDTPGPNPPPRDGAVLDGGADPTLPPVPDPLAGPAPEMPTDDANAAAEPTAHDAAALVRDYYAAIGAQRFEEAYALWADDGRASGRSPEQFVAGFADTASLSVDVLEPGRVEPAAGSRYIEVPVAVTAVHRDGSRHRYVGAFTLRRSVVDGASDEQRAWRLQAADIREVRL